MANILLTSVGTAGDILPLIRIGSRLRRRGHAVTLLSHAFFGAAAAEAGLAFAALDTADDYARFIEDGPLVNSPQGVPEFFRRHSFPRIPREYQLIEERCKPGDTLLITRHLFDVGARLAAEKLGVPLLWVFVAPSQAMNEPVRRELFRTILAGDINHLRQDLGLPVVKDWPVWLGYPGPCLGLWPEWFAQADSSWPAAVTPVGFVRDNEGETGEVPPELQAVLQGSEPPVLITGGTGTFLGADFYPVSAAACRLAQRRAILVTRHDSQVPQLLPASIQRFQYLPLGKVMPSVAAVIHHGGRGTLTCALASGTPQVVLAFGADRPDNALRLKQLGVAEYLAPPAWSPRNVAAALERVIRSSLVRERCQELARQVTAADALSAACRIIEAAVTSTAPTFRPPLPAAENQPAAQPGEAVAKAAERLSPERLELLAALLQKQKAAAADRAVEAPPPALERKQASLNLDHLPGIHQRVEAWAELNPDAVALAFNEQTVTYGALNRRANQLAHYLQTLGMAAETLAGIYLPAGVDQVVAQLAILKAGDAVVPLDPAEPRERTALLLQDSRPAVVLSWRSLVGWFPGGQARVVCLDGAAEQIARHSETNPRTAVAAASRAYVLYSELADEPQGVLVSHQAVTHLVAGADYVRWEPGDVVAQCAGVSAPMVLFETWGALAHGAKLLGIPLRVSLSPPAFAAYLRRHRVSVLTLTATLFNHITNTVPDVFQPVAQVLFGGEMVSSRQVRAVLEKGPPQRLVRIHGPNDVPLIAAWQEVGTVLPEPAAIPIGRPSRGTHVRLLDAQLNSVSVGEPGELCVGGPGLPLGFLNRPELTTARFVGDAPEGQPGARLYRTGDRARNLPDGTLEFLGCQANQTVIRGRLIAVEEIETLLSLHPAVRLAVVVPKKDLAGEQALVAFVVAKPQELADIKRFADQHLAPDKRPAAFATVDNLPLLANGLVNRRALQEVNLQVPIHQTQTPPRDPLEDMIVQIWEEFLKVRPIGAHDDFFKLGGNLQLASAMLTRLEQECRVKVPLALLFAGATVEQLTRPLLEAIRRRQSLLLEAQAGAGKRPFFFFHGDFNGGGYYCLPLARRLAADQPFLALHPLGLTEHKLAGSIEALASAYLDILLSVQPEGPYLLGGHCNGALVAFETAQRLLARGQAVDLLVLVDPSGTKLSAVPPAPAGGFPSSALATGPTELDPTTLPAEERRWALFEHYRILCASYAPQPYPARLTLFQLHEVLVTGWDRSTEWRALARELDSHLLPGKHLTALTRNVDALAERLQKCLDGVASSR